MIRSLSISIVSSSVVNLATPSSVLVDAEVGWCSVEEEAEDGRRDEDEQEALELNANTESKETMNERLRGWCTFLASWSSYRQLRSADLLGVHQGRVM